jgi:GDPmannose 4,6-dehydratase
MKAIIFGINSQDGYYLSKLLAQNSIEVIGVSRHSGNWLKGDVADSDFVEELIKEKLPDFIFHFAAISSTNHSVMFENQRSIVSGTLNILESVKRYCPHSKVFLSGSALQFQNVDLPIDESAPFQASSAYALARIQSVYAGRYYRENFGLQVYIGYFFHHDSPLRTEQHLSQLIVSAAKRISAGSQEKLELGDLGVKKEFNFAGDIVKAVWMLVNQERVVEAVIGSGIAYSIKDWVEYCFKKVGLNWKDHVTTKQGFTPEYKILVSNPKLIKSLGWKPSVDFSALADIMMEHK